MTGTINYKEDITLMYVDNHTLQTHHIEQKKSILYE